MAFNMVSLPRSVTTKKPSERFFALILGTLIPIFSRIVAMATNLAPFSYSGGESTAMQVL